MEFDLHILSIGIVAHGPQDCRLNWLSFQKISPLVYWSAEGIIVSDTIDKIKKFHPIGYKTILSGKTDLREPGSNKIVSSFFWSARQVGFSRAAILKNPRSQVIPCCYMRMTHSYFLTTGGTYPVSEK
jgi:hypothetical protein